MTNQSGTSQAHPAAAIVPMLEGTSYDSLKEDIQVNGQQVPIVLWDGLVIDGRNRLRACCELGVAPKMTQLSKLPGGSPTMYVLSANLHRRHLSPSQLAMVAARARDEFDREAKLRQAGLVPRSGDARDVAGRAVGVSGKSVDYATKVLKDGVREIVAACDSGKLSVSKAARLVQLPEQEQLAALGRPLAAAGPLRPMARPPLSAFRLERTTTFAAFDQLVTKARELESFIGQRCGCVGSLVEQGQFELPVLSAGVQRVEEVGSLLLLWAKQARRELRSKSNARRVDPVAAE